MRITKLSKDEYLRLYQIANEGCYVCPCCGETLSMMEALKQGFKNRGILQLWFPRPRCVRKGFLNYEYKQVTEYVCITCRAEWESDPY